MTFKPRPDGSQPRKLSKLEANLLGLKQSEVETMELVLRGFRVHPHQWGKGFRTLHGMKRRRIIQILRKIDIGVSTATADSKDIELGNDAPRQGADGKWVQLTATGRSKARRRLA